MAEEWTCIDGDEAAARVAYALTEVMPIYPITPSSPMGEAVDAWAAAGRRNLWGTVPDVVEMQSEAGAAGALHGAVQRGALAASFTASQGLLLMIPNMFKIAGELTPAVIHVAARTVATHALSIFGDHSDVMHARTTGWSMLASASVQEAHDLALIAHVATLRARVPFLHFFDGFRTSHEVHSVRLLSEDDLRALLPEEEILAFRGRALTPDAPLVRGTAQNPDAYFQGREACNRFYLAIPGIVAETMDAFDERVGRRYGLVDYVGAPDAERVVVLMGSGIGAAEQTTDALVAAGERVGLLKIRLYRPFPAEAFVRALPSTVRSIAVLDRTKEPGAPGEPLYLDVVAALAEDADSTRPHFERPPRVIGGRYGLSSKEFTPGMAKAVFDALVADDPRRHFTVGITDDVTGLSLPEDTEFRYRRPAGEVQAMFFGTGADGTVGANKSSVKIIGESTDLWAQGYFVYDSKKAGSVTVSHLRFGPNPIRSTYLIERADFVACHQFGLLGKLMVLGHAREGGTFLLNSPYPAAEVWDHLPGCIQEQIIAKRLKFWVIDADGIAADVGMGERINTVMQPCFFALSGVLPVDEALRHIKEYVVKTYGKRGQVIVDRNFAAIDRSLEELEQVDVPEAVTCAGGAGITVPEDAPEFVKRVTVPLLAGEGDLLPVSAFPEDGSFITGTTKYEKRAIARQIPLWDPELCIDCGKCSLVCPHAVIRLKVYRPDVLAGAPDGFPSKDFRAKELSGYKLTVQASPDDCTGCGVCFNVCPARSKTEARRRALSMEPALETRDAQRTNWEFFASIPLPPRDLLPHTTVKGSQLLEPLFEFSGACAGCGETPYVKLVSQLFGDRIVIANSTGCSSIYGGNLPTTPWTFNEDGRGPAWNNSLFEDTAEFGMGMRMGSQARVARARLLLERLASRLDADLVKALLESPQDTEGELREQRRRVAELVTALHALDGGDPEVRCLLSLADDLVTKGVWIIGGDGWAYDIGFGGLDHVLAAGRNVNILVLDTEVYSNTGGQASKATPRGAVAKFAASGKATPKKDLGALAMAYGTAYVAQIAVGANDAQTVKALLEADAWPGPSLVIAYCTCTAHGLDMSQAMGHMRDAVKSGYWPLYRFNPTATEDGRPFKLDSRAPAMPVREFISTEARFAMLKRTHPETAERLYDLIQSDVDERWRYYEQLAAMSRTAPATFGGASARDEAGRGQEGGGGLGPDAEGRKEDRS
ncbi:MAG TPA: pyruvate:ferredoxin (flavodoxin) oxidoreductase [Thermoleophilia bacterium]|nr:pyruvate:ferredoxin (flavodoxin) oxidoreductase [Thermoleophilia bacterium]